MVQNLPGDDDDDDDISSTITTLDKVTVWRDSLSLTVAVYRSADRQSKPHAHTHTNTHIIGEQLQHTPSRTHTHTHIYTLITCNRLK